AGGARVKSGGPRRMVTAGPFRETEDLVAGFWLWQVRSKAEAIEWLERAPFDGGTEVELRQVFEAEDFGPALTPELREQEERQRRQIQSKKKRALEIPGRVRAAWSYPRRPRSSLQCGQLRDLRGDARLGEHVPVGPGGRRRGAALAAAAVECDGDPPGAAIRHPAIGDQGHRIAGPPDHLAGRFQPDRVPGHHQDPRSDGDRL